MTTPQDTYSPLAIQLEDMQPHTAMLPAAPTIPETTEPNVSWQTSPSALASPINGTIETHGLGRARADSSSQGSRSMAPITSSGLDSQSMSAERWRKYF